MPREGPGEKPDDGSGDGAARAEAFSVARRFPAALRREFCKDRHYLLHAVSGTVRMEAEGRAWTLTPPAPQ